MWCSAVGCIMMLTLSLLMVPPVAAAQSVGKLPRIGVLAPGSPPGEPGRGLDRLRQGLRDLGYVEGQTIAFEVQGWPGHRAGQHAHPRVVADDVVEDEGHRVGPPVVDLAGRTDLEVPMRPADVTHLAELLDRGQPAPQVVAPG